MNRRQFAVAAAAALAIMIKRARHLCGTRGVLAALEQDGYRVARVY